MIIFKLDSVKRTHFYIVFLFFLNGIVFSQTFNRLNKKGERTGKWLVYLDSAKTKKSYEGRFRNGRSVGTFYYYTTDGILERKEINRFKKLKTTFYYPDGTRRQTGKARIKNEPDKIHYFFYGRWKYYDEKGKLLKYRYYSKGNLVKTVYLDKNNKTNDSLINALNALDKHFAENNRELLDSISLSAYDPLRRERLQLELYMTDTLTFHQLDVILLRYNYPSGEKVKEAVVIPFYILSFAPLGIREKYLESLKKAADNRDISWKSLAFYIDKIKIAKGQKQVYGTQYYFRNKELVYYPCEDPENLGKRRESVGL